MYNFEFDYYKRIHDFCNSLDGNIFNTKLRDFLLKARECLENTNQTPITADEVKRFFIMDSKSNKLVTSIPKTSICSTSNFILDESSVADFIKRTISSIGRGDNRGVTNFSKKRVKDSMNKKMNLNASRDNYFFL